MTFPLGLTFRSNQDVAALFRFYSGPISLDLTLMFFPELGIGMLTKIPLRDSKYSLMLDKRIESL
jgi:hypothetical protein